MKKILLSSLVMLSLQSFAQTNCESKAQYDCRVLVEEHVITLLLTDKETGKETVFHTHACTQKNDLNCKSNWVHYFSGKIMDFRANGFCL